MAPSRQPLVSACLTASCLGGLPQKQTTSAFVVLSLEWDLEPLRENSDFSHGLLLPVPSTKAITLTSSAYAKLNKSNY